ncbi:MAG: hypothetical protein HY785_11700 [Oscillatoriophycideae cyanobacterium NC_groundwater_1537_Pr4_S-0.65um_50_18]|nr:hypothetical protein [Oscillatoriophycideae cyanobacterium NC_groundwater_1537_Pr4_S-0.65um_50_18]
MQRFRMRNVILPAVLVSSGVFSILTLPFILDKTEVLGFTPPPFLEDTPQTFLDRENKSTAIRYVGGAIVVSVSAGVATIEILRRMHPANQLSKTQKDALNSQIRQLEAEGKSDPLLLTENVETAIAEFLSEQEGMPSGLPTQKVKLSQSYAPTSEFETNNRRRDLSEFPLEESAATHVTFGSIIDSDWVSPEPHPPQNGSPTLTTSDFYQPFEPINLSTDSLGQSNQSYETYRIRVPHRQDTLLAILVEGDYYSLVRSHTNQEKVMELATRLYQLGDRVIITFVDQKYAVWVLQPEAYLEWMS